MKKIVRFADAGIVTYTTEGARRVPSRRPTALVQLDRKSGAVVRVPAVRSIAFNEDGSPSRFETLDTIYVQVAQ